MVLCELMSNAPEAFLMTWFIIIMLTMLSVAFFSGAVFFYYYVRPTYEKWRYKINPKFPSPQDVRLEIIQTLKGVLAASFCPALSLYMTQHGYSQAYCGLGDYGYVYLVVSFFAMWVLSDLWEWGYHYLGHTQTSMWQVHKHHHRFFNPSPFAVIADEPLDQFMRALPMVLFPMLMPVNMDMLFLQFAVFFYAYGVYLHWGYELEYPDAHHPWLNTSYQHFAHHQLSVMNKPYHTGFYVKFWDQIAGSMYPREKCFCSKCARAKGERELKAWEEVKKPDYSPLLSASFWINGQVKGHAAKAA